MKVSHVLGSGKEVIVDIAENGTVTVIDAPEVTVKVPYVFGSEGSLASVRKGMLEVTTTARGVSGLPQVVLVDHGGAVLPVDKIALITEEGGNCVAMARGEVGMKEVYKFEK